MYGLVLMMALGSSAETPEFGRKGCGGCDGGGCHGGLFGGHGGHGCGGGLFGGHGGHGCGGGLFGGHGCGGGLFSGHGGGGKLFGGHGCGGGGLFARHGGDGGCSHSCHGGGLFSRLRKRHGCGGCHADHGCSVSHGCSAAHHDDCCPPAVSHGCAGGHVIGCEGGHIIGGGSTEGGHMKMEEKKDGAEKLKEMPKEKTDKKGASLPAPATIVVESPVDAQLTIDDAATRSTSTVRRFVTPNLTPAKTFTYTLKAQVVRDGQTLVVAETVAVKAGEETRVTFDAGRFSTFVTTSK